jgi:hypothetical protein
MEAESLCIREAMEDRVRVQLENCDRLQGFQVWCDTNAGYGAVAQVLLSEFVKDEAPKAPIVLWSIKNQVRMTDVGGGFNSDNM